MSKDFIGKQKMIKAMSSMEKLATELYGVAYIPHSYRELADYLHTDVSFIKACIDYNFLQVKKLDNRKYAFRVTIPRENIEPIMARKILLIAREYLMQKPSYGSKTNSNKENNTQLQESTDQKPIDSKSEIEYAISILKKYGFTGTLSKVDTINI